MKRRTLGALAGAVLILTACVENTGPDADVCAAPTAQIELALSAAALEPSDPAVCRHQVVTLIISPEVDGVFHIHGYDEEVPATEVRSGAETELQFTASRSGQFPIELHALDDPAGVEIGVFTVHEP